MNAVDSHRQANSQMGGHEDHDKGTIDGARPATTRFLTMLIRSYQVARSGRPTGCRYLPTCSQYALEAVETHGPGHGSLLAAQRIARCGPWGGHGVDPVPERSSP
jgi:putative membrane protein insertion efficiency factor